MTIEKKVELLARLAVLNHSILEGYGYLNRDGPIGDGVRDAWDEAEKIVKELDAERERE